MFTVKKNQNQPNIPRKVFRKLVRDSKEGTICLNEYDPRYFRVKIYSPDEYDESLENGNNLCVQIYRNQIFVIFDYEVTKESWAYFNELLERKLVLISKTIEYEGVKYQTPFTII